MEIDIDGNKKFIQDFLMSTKRIHIDRFLNWLELGTDFFSAPASSKFHLNVPGGLAYHSISVFKTLRDLSREYLTDLYRNKIDTIIITGLLHDVCKVDIYEKIMQYDIEEGSFEGDYNTVDKWKGEYNRNDKFPVGHGDKSVILILRHGLHLTDLEIGMIRWHMCMYDQSYYRNQSDIVKVFPEAKLLYFADDISTQYLED